MASPDVAVSRAPAGAKASEAAELLAPEAMARIADPRSALSG